MHFVDIGLYLKPSSLFILCDVIQFRWRVTSHTSTTASPELRKVSVDTATDVYGNGAHGMKEVNQAFDLPSAKCRAAPQTPTSQFQKATVANRTY